MFKIDFIVNNESLKKNLIKRDFPSEYDIEWVNDLLFYFCENIGKFSEFIIYGFLEDKWGLHVRPDFEIFLEALPEALKDLNDKTKDSFYIYLYEQGVDRTIIFNKNAHYLDISCECTLQNWKPKVNIEKISIEDFKKMILNIIIYTDNIINNFFFEIKSNKYYIEWFDKILKELN